MAPSTPRFAPPPQLDCFLHATIGVERNGVNLSVLSLLARAGHDLWAEAARLAELPRDAAADSLANTFASLPAGSLPPAQARMIALCLVPLLPDQDHPAPDILGASRRLDRCMRVALLAGAMLSAALVLGLLVAAAVWDDSHAGPSDASAGGTVTARPSPVEEPGCRQAAPERRPARVHPAIVRAA